MLHSPAVPSGRLCAVPAAGTAAGDPLCAWRRWIHAGPAAGRPGTMVGRVASLPSPSGSGQTVLPLPDKTEGTHCNIVAERETLPERGRRRFKWYHAARRLSAVHVPADRIDGILSWWPRRRIRRVGEGPLWLHGEEGRRLDRARDSLRHGRRHR